MSNPRQLIENTLVPHTAFNEAIARIEQCFVYALEASEPICIAVLGESRTGKSRVLEECAAAHPPSRSAAGLMMPILRVKTPAKPTVKSLAEVLLTAMRDPKAHAGSENSKTARLRTLMQNAGTHMVMIDEFQHFQDKGSMVVMHYASDWLKNLVDDSKVALVVAGLPRCQEILAQNEQIAGRFLAPILMPRFDWKNDGHREEFTAIVGAFQESMAQHFDMPRLDSNEMVFRTYCACGGLVGYLTKFLRQLVWNTIESKTSKITLTAIAQAHQQSVWISSITGNAAGPFTRAFDPVPRDDLLAKIMQLGTPVQPPKRARRPRSSSGVIGRYATEASL